MASSWVVEGRIQEEPRLAAAKNPDFSDHTYSVLIIIGQIKHANQAEHIAQEIERGMAIDEGRHYLGAETFFQILLFLNSQRRLPWILKSILSQCPWLYNCIAYNLQVTMLRQEAMFRRVQIVSSFFSMFPLKPI